MVRPYTDDICRFWRFKTPEIAKKSAAKIYEMYLIYRDKKDFIGMDMCRKFLEMGFTRSRRYANHYPKKKIMLLVILLRLLLYLKKQEMLLQKTKHMLK